MDSLNGNNDSDSEQDQPEGSCKEGMSRREFLKQGLGSAGFLALNASGIGAMMQRNGVRDSDFEDQIDEMLNDMTVQEKIEQLRYDAPAIPRLDIEEYNWWNECLHGVGRAGYPTVFHR